MRRKHLTILGEENKNPNCALILMTRLSSQKIKTLKSKINPWIRKSNQRIYICSFVPHIRDCTQILWNTNKCHLFIILWLQNLTPSLPLIYFSKVKTFKSKQHFLQRSHGYKKCCLSSFERTPDLSVEDPAYLAPSREDRCMECKQEAWLRLQ